MANKKYTKKQSKKKSGGHCSNSNANAKPKQNHDYYQESSSDDESYYHCEHAIAEHIFECFVRHKIAEKLHEQMFDQVTVTVLIYLFFTFTIGLLFSFFFMISILNYLASSGIGLVCFAAAWLFSVYSEYDLTVFTRVPSQLAIVIYLFLFRFTLAHTYILDYLGGNELIYQFVSSIFRIIVTLAIMMNLVSGMQMLKGGPLIEHVHPLNCNRTQVVLSMYVDCIVLYAFIAW